ncbi:hypothetical protein KSP39_PZI016891 [Platanthera zijinensis]|uniref:Uncharacterized protein n=1 Tax=Platanthera zijinensis TaxID=2320716 RepID=A0AAP0B7W6_9ASPA
MNSPFAILKSDCDFRYGRSIARYLCISAVPAQINPNGVAMILEFLHFLRSEKITFDLSVFQKIFAFAETSEGFVFLSIHVCTLVSTTNMVHRWGEWLVIVSGNFE